MKNILKKSYFWRRIAMVVMLVLIMIAPSFSNDTSARQDLDLNVWFIVDATGSMVAKDVENGNTRRFEKVESDIESIVKGVPGAKFSMIVQDYYSYTASPLSSDSEATISALGYVQPKNSLYNQPTNLSDLLKYSHDVIEKYQIRFPDRINALVFLSDGEDYSDTRPSVPDGLAGLLKRAYVLGYGSQKGTIVEQVGIYGTSLDRDEYKPTAINPERFVTYFGKNSKVEVDSDYRVISKLDEENLNNISNSLNGKYYHRESGSIPEEITKSLRDIASVIRVESPSSINSRTETYWVFALILLGLILWEGIDVLNRLLLEKEVKNA